MATQIKVPHLGDGVESGDVLEIYVSVGDTITAGQDLVELETDKSTVPVPADASGKVVKICIAEGDTIAVGDVILELEAASGASGGGAGAAAPTSGAAQASAAKEPTATAKPAASPPVANVAKPASATPAAPAAQQTTKPATTAAQASASPASPVAPKVPQSQSQGMGGESPAVIPAGPAVRRFAREVGIDLENVSGTGEGGRITREDVLAAVRSSNQGRVAASALNPSASSPAASSTGTTKARSAADASNQSLPGTANNDDFGPIRVERMNRMRKTIAAQMSQSWTQVPRVTNFDDADITDLERLRQASKEDYADQGLKLTTMPFLIKAVATALKHNPQINAVIDSENEQLIYKDYINIGVAVDTDRGLVVPVMKNADRMGIPDIARALAEMAATVRGGQFPVSELRGGTFSISNLGAIGGTYSTPIVNVPEVAILLVGRSRKLPCVMPDDSIQARLMMPLSLSYDHRLVDGGTAARFLNDVISYLEAPSRLLLAL